MKMKQIGLFLLVGFLLLACQQEKTRFVPDAIADFKRVKTLQGEEARTYINRLHFKKVAPQNNVIAFYRNQQQQLILYLTFYEQNADALKDWQRMVQKISPENSVFVQGSVLQVGDKQVYRCFGMGQTHFVFVYQKALIWLSVPTVGAMDLLQTYNRLLD